MKKYIVVHLIFLQFVSFQLNAMDKLCPFIRLPCEVCNIIASFLMWETKEAIIKRIKTLKGLSASWSRYEPKCKYNGFVEELFRVLCPDESKMAIVKLFFCDRAKPILTIIDQDKKSIYNGKFAYQIYQDVALSQCGHMIATIQKQEAHPGDIVHYYKNILVIQKVVAQKDQEKEEHKNKQLQKLLTLTLPSGYDPSSLTFNKQGTHVMICGIKYGVQGSSNKRYMFVPLNTVNCKKSVPDIHKIHEGDNALAEYFRYHSICKNIKNSITESIT